MPSSARPWRRTSRADATRVMRARATIEVNDLPEFLRLNDAAAVEFRLRPGMTLAEVERTLIRHTLSHVSANREEAARVLGISRRTLQYKLKEYGLLGDASAS